MEQFTERRIEGLILDSMSEGALSVDENWRITTFNRAAERITGVARADAVGRRCCDVLRSTICEGECALRRAIETGQPVVNRAIRIVNAEGRLVPVCLSAAILRDSEGRAAGGVETFRDLTAEEGLRQDLRSTFTFGDIVGRSPAMRRLLELVPQVAQSQEYVLILGPAGTGKGLLARAIHNHSPRRDGRLVAADCRALPAALLESELFGDGRQGGGPEGGPAEPGLFLMAQGGTLLLEEIDAMPSEVQARLLRALDGHSTHEGAPRSGTRILATSCCGLEERAGNGQFLEALYRRLGRIRLELPPLRERRVDIPLLTDHFIARFNRLHARGVAAVSDEVMAALMAHDFPGNVAELEDIIEQALIACPGAVIEPGHLPPGFRDGLHAARHAGPQGLTLNEFEAIHITDAVRRHGGNRTAAAAELGINPSTLFRKVKALSIDLPAQDGRARQRD
ncbi:MAG: sigma 54-interacting transcriptional regulator [Candidatus Hydrogenedentes bacterium]|nr:sigma 54-interacting transcriptional regulator [Candidatus Hydrogenedentota bacterium]